MKKNKLIILGIDGLSYENWPRFASAADMPNSERIMKHPSFRRMLSSVPDVSSAAWASIMTGADPGTHNVFGFTDIIDGTYTLGFTSYNTLKAKPFWHWNPGLKHLIMNVPQTYPAAPMPGSLVSGYVALDLERSVFPTEKLRSYEESGYQVDVDMSLLGTSRDLFLDELSKVLDTRLRMLDTLWKEDNWDVLMFVITGTDRLCHYFWDQWEDPEAKYRDRFLEFFAQVDRAIGHVLELVGDDDTFILVSDHGFERQRFSLNLNALLSRAGYLSIEKSKRISYASIRAESRAFCMDPGRIYLHRAGKYPSGSVEDHEAPALLDELTEFFATYEIEGAPIAREVLRGEDLYSGPYSRRGPDLVVMSAPGVSFSGRVRDDELFEKTGITGKHRHDDAVFAMIGPGTAAIPEIVRVADVLPIAVESGAIER